MWRPVSFAADKNRPYPRQTVIVIIVLALFTLLLPLLEERKEREREKRKKENSRTLVPLNCFFLGKWMCRRSLKISRYRITSYYRELLKVDLIKRRERKK